MTGKLHIPIPDAARAAHPLVIELFRTLPDPGAEFSLDRRVCWLEAAAACFNVIYGNAGEIEILFSPADRDR